MIQVFDVDKSLSVLGEGSELQKIFGLPPIQLTSEFTGERRTGSGELVTKTGMDEHLRLYLDKLFEKYRVTVKNPIFDAEFEEIRTFPTERAKKIGLRGIVIDSISGFGDAVRNDLIDTHRFEAMTKDLWGKYGSRMSATLTTLRDIPCMVILTAHIDRMEEAGNMLEFVGIKGGQKTDALRSFDVIVYTYVDEEGHIHWQVNKSPNRPWIRSRMPVPEWEGEHLVEPDFLPVLRAYKKSPTPLKMIVVGDSGTGKTTSLGTLAPYVAAVAEGMRKKKQKSKTEEVQK